MAGRLPKGIFKTRKTKGLDDRSVFTVFRSRHTLHRVRIQILETDSRNDIVSIALKGLNDLNTVRDGPRFMCEANRPRQRLSALLCMDKIHEGCGLHAAQTGRSQSVVTKFGSSDTTR